MDHILKIAFRALRQIGGFLSATDPTANVAVPVMIERHTSRQLHR